MSSTESCDGPIPPGACCKQCGMYSCSDVRIHCWIFHYFILTTLESKKYYFCYFLGGLVNAIIDHKGLNYSSNSMNATSINSTNILERMRLHLEMVKVSEN